MIIISLCYKLQRKSSQPCTEERLEMVGSARVIWRTGGHTVITSVLAVWVTMSPASVDGTTCTPPVSRVWAEAVCAARLTAGLRPAAADAVSDGRCGYDGTTTAYRSNSSYSSLQQAEHSFHEFTQISTANSHLTNERPESPNYQ